MSLKPQEVIFKGTRKGLRLVLDADDNIENLKEMLRRRLEESKEFYSGASVTLETRGTVVPPEWVEEVRTILDEYGLSMGSHDVSAPRQRTSERLPSPEVSGLEAGQAPGHADSILLRRSLRSGQSISFEGNIVIMGDLNPGSEVSATGDIVVFGALRGVAHAGTAGSQDARVVALKLMPTQLRIADRITRAPDNEVQAPLGPEIAFLRDGSIVIEPWTSH
ncbi:MAG: septum site-determining protein MinC [Clostridia bacterium]|nr:septum site-determining protein MinC [Clostridia bacterium]